MVVRGTVRSQYLRVMGIREWLPRKPLPGAKPSPVLSVPQSAVPLAGRQPNDDAVPEPKEIKRFLEKEDLQAFSRAVHAQPKISVPDKVEPSIPPRFKLQGLLFAGQYLVISDTTTGFDPALQADPMRLLMSLLSALGNTSLKMPVVLNFSWPLVRSNHIDQGVDVAKDAVQAFVKKQLVGQDVSVIIIMGQNAQKFILSKDNISTGVQYLEKYDVVVTKSLIDMLSSPLCKRQVWCDLKRLQLS